MILTQITQCILSNSILCILGCNISYSYYNQSTHMLRIQSPQWLAQMTRPGSAT
jgi:hypothetical protein